VGVDGWMQGVTGDLAADANLLASACGRQPSRRWRRSIDCLRLGKSIAFPGNIELLALYRRTLESTANVARTSLSLCWHASADGVLRWMNYLEYARCWVLLMTVGRCAYCAWKLSRVSVRTCMRHHTSSEDDHRLGGGLQTNDM
jgi:hypothetical protein